MAVIKGFKGLRIAELLSDTSGGVSYGAITAIGGAQSLDIDPQFDVKDIPGDDKTYATTKNFKQLNVKLSIAECPLSIMNLLEGGTYDSGTKTYTYKTTNDNPYIAVMGEAPKADGTSQGIKIFKVKIEKVTVPYKTADSASVEIEGKALGREYDNKVYEKKDDIPASYFNAVEGIGDTTAPTVTTNPTDGATGVAVSANFVWTFSEEIQSSCVTSANFFLMKASDGSLVAGTLAYNAAARTVTFDPTVDLSAATAYIAVCTTNVRDLAGNSLAANNVTNFTTA